MAVVPTANPVSCDVGDASVDDVVDDDVVIVLVVDVVLVLLVVVVVVVVVLSSRMHRSSLPCHLHSGTAMQCDFFCFDVHLVDAAMVPASVGAEVGATGLETHVSFLPFHLHSGSSKHSFFLPYEEHSDPSPSDGCATAVGVILKMHDLSLRFHRQLSANSRQVGFLVCTEHPKIVVVVSADVVLCTAPPGPSVVSAARVAAGGHGRLQRFVHIACTDGLKHCAAETPLHTKLSWQVAGVVEPKAKPPSSVVSDAAAMAAVLVILVVVAVVDVAVMDVAVAEAVVVVVSVTVKNTEGGIV
jgi:hypothetical protein